jgi:hypothetical protein
MSEQQIWSAPTSAGALDFLAFSNQGIQSGVALRLPPHSKN